MVAQAWPVARAFTNEKRREAWRKLRRAAFAGTHADVVAGYEFVSGRTRFRLLSTVVSAFVLYNVSALSPSVITLSYLALAAVEVVCHQLRAWAARLPASRWDIPLFTFLLCFLYASWAAMPLVLQFRSPPEVLTALIILVAVLISVGMIAVQVPVCLISVFLVAGAILAPELVNAVSPHPQMGLFGTLVIKILFLINYSLLVRTWYVTARREERMRAELEQRRQQAEDLAAAKAMFLAHMSHEIRSPLAAVTLMANLLRRLEDVPEDQRQMIEQIDAGGQEILSLLNAVLDYSKIEAGKIALVPRPTDVRALLDSVVSLSQLRARETATRLSFSIPETLPSSLMLDEMRVRQVVSNLVTNAIKHSAGATVRVAAGYDHASGTLLVDVIDTGPGVDEAVKQRLFEPARQQGADSGTGLGLAISHGLVKLMGGQIGVRDTLGGGTTFWTRIPAAQDSV